VPGGLRAFPSSRGDIFTNSLRRNRQGGVGIKEVVERSGGKECDGWLGKLKGWQSRFSAKLGDRRNRAPL